MTPPVNLSSRLFASSVFSFVTDVHDRLTRRGNQTTLHLGSGALAFLREALDDTDRFFKVEDPFAYTYLHHTLPLGGHSPAVMERLGLNGASGGKMLDEMFRISRERSTQYTANLINQTQGMLTHRQQGEILFLWGRLLHCTQDKKHREDNRATPPNEPFEWPAHISPLGSERQHMKTDEDPPPAMEERALDRTIALMNDLLSSLDREIADKARLEEALRRLRNFQKSPGESVDDFKPQNYSFIFPPYEPKMPSYYKTPFSLGLAYDTYTLRPSLGLNLRVPLLKAARFKTSLELFLNGGYSFEDALFLKSGLGPVFRPFDRILLEPRAGLEIACRSQFGEKATQGVQAAAYAGIRTNFPFLILAENGVMLGMNLYFPLWSSKGYPPPNFLASSGLPYFLASLDMALP